MPTFTPDRTPVTDSTTTDLDSTPEGSLPATDSAMDPADASSEMMEDLGAASPSDFLQFLPNSPENQRERLIEAANNPGQIIGSGEDAIALDDAAAAMIRANPDFAMEFIVEGEVVGQREYQKAMDSLDDIEAQGEVLLSLHKAYKENWDSMSRSQQRSLDRRFRRELREYTDLVDKYKHLTGHEIQLVARTSDSIEDARSIVEEQHRLAEQAAVDAFTRNQRDYMEAKAGMADYEWVEDQNLAVFLDANPDQVEHFRDSVGAGEQREDLGKYFGEGKHEVYGVDRDEIIPGNGVVDVNPITGESEELSAEEQITRALDPQVRSENLQGRLDNPLYLGDRDQTLRLMEQVVRVFGTYSEREQLSEYRREEMDQISDAVSDARREERREREQQQMEERQRVVAEQQREIQQTLERMIDAGQTNNSFYRSAMRNPANLEYVSNYVYEQSTDRTIERQVQAELAAESAARDARVARESQRHSIRMENRFSEIGQDVDLSARREQLQIREAVATVRQEILTEISQDIPFDRLQYLNAQLEQISPIWEQLEQNMRETNPDNERPISVESLPAEVRNHMQQNTETQGREVLSSIYSLFRQQNQSQVSLSQINAELVRVTAEDFDPTTLNLGDANFEDYLSDLQSRKASYEQEIAGRQNAISRMFEGLDLESIDEAERLVRAAIRERGEDELLASIEAELRRVKAEKQQRLEDIESRSNPF